jgi:hypothetical protein
LLFLAVDGFLSAAVRRFPAAAFLDVGSVDGLAARPLCPENTFSHPAANFFVEPVCSTVMEFRFRDVSIAV